MKIGKPTKEDLRSYLEDVAARQRNTTWPDVLRGGRSVDAYLFKGDRRAPLIQRIGTLVLACTCILLALSFIDLYVTQKVFLEALFALASFCAAGWLTRIAFMR